MIRNRRQFGRGTYLDAEMPWSLFKGGAALCSDGQVRRLKRISPTADTFFSTPASVVVQGKAVSGYVTVETVQGFGTETPDDPAIVKFVAYRYGKNADLLPAKGA